MMEATVLSCLLEGELHGYDLVDKIEETIGAYVCVDPGSTYRLLRDLENGGHLASIWQPAESGPARRIYSVTASGRELLAQWATFLERRADVMKALAARARQRLGIEAQGRPGNNSQNEA
jgi:DNA-binding PadR family transcriptional regulator